MNATPNQEGKSAKDGSIVKSRTVSHSFLKKRANLKKKLAERSKTEKKLNQDLGIKTIRSKASSASDNDNPRRVQTVSQLKRKEEYDKKTIDEKAEYNTHSHRYSSSSKNEELRDEVSIADV